MRAISFGGGLEVQFVAASRKSVLAEGKTTFDKYKEEMMRRQRRDRDEEDAEIRLLNRIGRHEIRVKLENLKHELDQVSLFQRRAFVNHRIIAKSSKEALRRTWNVNASAKKEEKKNKSSSLRRDSKLIELSEEQEEDQEELTKQDEMEKDDELFPLLDLNSANLFEAEAKLSRVLKGLLNDAFR